MDTSWKRAKVSEHSQGRPVIDRLKNLDDSLFTISAEKRRERMMSPHRIIKCMNLAEVNTLNSCDGKSFPGKFIDLQALSRIFQIEEAISVDGLYHLLNIWEGRRSHKLIKSAGGGKL